MAIQRSHKTSSNLSKYNMTNIRELLSMILAYPLRTSLVDIDCKTCTAIDYTGKDPALLLLALEERVIRMEREGTMSTSIELYKNIQSQKLSFLK